MKILITGATGLIGHEIVKLCETKRYFVHYLTTSKDKIENTAYKKGFYWNPKSQEIDVNCLKGVDAIINLAGASISKRWTEKQKKIILSSRIDTVKLLYKLLSENEHKVTHFSSASALGIYPSSLDKKYSEKDDAIINDSFLGEVVKKWEDEVDTIEGLGITVSKLRTGIVLSEKGGALEQMSKPIKFYVGAPLGSGKQIQSWIHVTDMAKMYLFAIEHNLDGIFNAAASNPVSNQMLTEAIAKQLNKPIWLPNIPAFMLKLVLGEMSAIVLDSQYLLNDKIKDQGFQFQYDWIDDPLEDCL
ncbi:TIGR01777 family oxidoreductase [Aureibaculum sp. 2210JD6-5]|uniref:TIGR01777 family oxidoreductase n=1 Tax=Aureibaculum sp. 2210JD6-5 TaxID=3103957 RepID=UPI002AADC1A8|nr:TIGR01777 family oxidoreductase [Aureibaculum sp. 2210JD6-5]MDY7395642.1 TIGR01777 family oxidoreductase [Aureibaculum sp. 2210JD6-5]